MEEDIAAFFCQRSRLQQNSSTILKEFQSHLVSVDPTLSKWRDTSLKRLCVMEEESAFSLFTHQTTKKHRKIDEPTLPGIKLQWRI